MVNLAEEQIEQLYDAVTDASAKVRAEFRAPPVFTWFVDPEEIADVAGAASDLERLDMDPERVHRTERQVVDIDMGDAASVAEEVQRMAGYGPLRILVYNPGNSVATVPAGREEATVERIWGGNTANVYQAQVDFSAEHAFLPPEHQSVAHRAGFMYTPGDMLETDPTAASDGDLHNEKSARDTVYCDNTACQDPIYNPVLVVDRENGGVYHSPVCFRKDARIKEARGVETDAEKISIHEARRLYEDGELQQSPDADSPHNSLDPLNPAEALHLLPV